MVANNRQGWQRLVSRPEPTATPPNLTDAILRLQLARARASDDPTAAAIAVAATLLLRQGDRGLALTTFTDGGER